MSKFRKKPVVIEAVQVKAVDWNGVSCDGWPFRGTAVWLEEAINKGILVPFGDDRDYALWKVVTLEDGPNGEAKHVAEPGDWIIRGIQGELYPCKPDIFAATYEPVEER